MDLRRLAWAMLLAVPMLLNGCSEAHKYEGVVRPTPKLAALSPEFENLTDTKVEMYLKAQVRPNFPTVLAVAKLPSPEGHFEGYQKEHPGTVVLLQGEEADRWRELSALRNDKPRPVISQVQFLNPMLVAGSPHLKTLRDAAALVHAPLLLVYTQQDNSDEGLNPAAMAYWSFIGLFIVPGHTVGRCSICQAVLVDTQTGFVLATAQGQSLVEEKVLPGAVDIARRRVGAKARQEAVAKLVADVQETLLELAKHPQTLPTTRKNQPFTAVGSGSMLGGKAPFGRAVWCRPGQ